MKIGIGINVVMAIIPGEGNPFPSMGGGYFSDDALTKKYFADDALTKRYVTEDPV